MDAPHCRKCKKHIFAPGVKPLWRTKIRCACGWVQVWRPEPVSDLVKAARDVVEAKERVEGKATLPSSEPVGSLVTMRG